MNLRQRVYQHGPFEIANRVGARLARALANQIIKW